VEQFVENVGFFEFNQVEADVLEAEGDECWFALRTYAGDFNGYLQQRDVDLVLATHGE